MTDSSWPIISKSRIESLADVIIGLALSISVLYLISQPPTTPADIQSHVIGFAFSFLILISVWTRYSWSMSFLRIESRGVLLLNIALFFLVPIEPYLLSLVNETSGALLDYGSFLYALDVFGLIAILTIFTHLLIVDKNKNAVLKSHLQSQKMLRGVFLFSAILFAISALPQFFSWNINGEPLRIYMWYASLIVIWIGVVLARKKS